MRRAAICQECGSSAQDRQRVASPSAHACHALRGSVPARAAPSFPSPSCRRHAASVARRRRASSEQRTRNPPPPCGEGLGVGGIPTPPGARHAGFMDDARGARRERQTLDLGKRDIRALRRKNGSPGTEAGRADPATSFFPGAVPRRDAPPCGPRPAPPSASTAPPRGMSGVECAVAVVGGDKSR